jgi:zinc protease
VLSPLLGLLACLSPGRNPRAPTPCCDTNPAPPRRLPRPGAQQFTLANGMQLIVQPDRRAPTAVHMVWVRVGSMDEVDGTSGVAHVLEHMMFKGTKTVPPGEFSRRVAALGGQENAFTSRDYTGYYQQIPAHRLEDVMRLESDRFAHNQWPDDEFKQGDRGGQGRAPPAHRRPAPRPAGRAAVCGHLHGLALPPPGGGLDERPGRPDARGRARFHRQWYVPGNAAVVVAGDVDVAQVRALAEKYYGRLPARALPARKPRTEPAQQGLRRIAVKAPAEQAYVALAFRVPGMNRGGRGAHRCRPRRPGADGAVGRAQRLRRCTPGARADPGPRARGRQRGQRPW